MFIKNLVDSYHNYYKQFYDKNKTLLNNIRIYLTESCNANCPHCFNKDIRDEGHMSYAHAKNLFTYLKDNDIRKLKIMGGEPTVHPHFVELYNDAQTKFETVALFTNALNDNILFVKPRKSDCIVYNFVFLGEKFNFDKLLPELGYDFPRAFEIVIDTNTNIQSMIDKINFVHDECKKRNIKHIVYQLTINCISNIFDLKEKYNKNFRQLLSFMIDNYPNLLSFDHTVPFCFWENETIKLMDDNKISYYKSTCRGTDFGLIDSKLNLLHCNQHPVIIFLYPFLWTEIRTLLDNYFIKFSFQEKWKNHLSLKSFLFFFQMQS